MNRLKSSSRFSVPEWVFVVASAIVFLTGLTVIYGWIGNHKALIQIRPEFAPMQFNTALLFVFSGLGFAGLLFQKGKLTLFSGLFVAIFSMVTGLQYVIGVSLGLDELFIDSTTMIKTSHPGRMAPNTAMCFFLTGLSLLTRIRFRSNTLFMIGGVFVFSLSVLALFGYLSRTEGAYGWGNLTRMAVHTATGFLLLSLVTISMAWLHSAAEDEGHRVPNWFPFLCGMVALSAGMCAWSIVEKLEGERDRLESGWAAEVFGMVFEAKLSSEASAIERIAKRWEDGIRGQAFQSDANQYLKDIGGLQAILRTGQGGILEAIFDEEEEEEEGQVYRKTEVYDALINLHEARQLKETLVGTVPQGFASQDERGFLIAVPIDAEGDPTRLMIGYVDFAAFFEGAIGRLEHVFEFRLFDSDNSLILGPAVTEGVKTGPDKEILKLNSHGQMWGVEAIARNGGLKTEIGLPLTKLVLISTILFAVVVTVIAGLAQRYHALHGERSDKEIREANEEMETMLFIIAHDLREPLRSVMSFSTMALDEYGAKLEKGGTDLLKRVVNGGRKIEKVIDGVTDVAKADKIQLSERPVDLGRLVREEIEQFRSVIEERGATVKVGSNLPKMRIDEVWVTQAISNLIGNALKFSEGDAPRIFIENYSGKEGAGIVVKDCGPGLPEKMEEKVFDLFRRGVSAKTPGSGIGLAIVKRVAIRHGGKAWARNRKGGGAEFYVTFGNR